MWGAPGIHGELLKLGFALAQSTVSKYMIRHGAERRTCISAQCGRLWQTRPTVPKKNGGDAILETYFAHRKAKTAWAIHKELTGSKPLKDATRDEPIAGPTLQG